MRLSRRVYNNGVKSGKVSAAKQPRFVRDEPWVRKLGLSYLPGPSRVPHSVIRKAMRDVIKARLERELGRPVKNSELKRDPKLPPIVPGPFRYRPVEARIRKTAPTVVRRKTAK